MILIFKKKKQQNKQTQLIFGKGKGVHHLMKQQTNMIYLEITCIKEPKGKQNQRNHPDWRVDAREHYDRQQKCLKIKTEIVLLLAFAFALASYS